MTLIRFVYKLFEKNSYLKIINYLSRIGGLRSLRN